jgi:hypothetical protein
MKSVNHPQVRDHPALRARDPRARQMIELTIRSQALPRARWTAAFLIEEWNEWGHFYWGFLNSLSNFSLEQ